jgi:hypothetical protein
LLKLGSYLQSKLLDTCVSIILLNFYQISLTVLITSPFICFVHIYNTDERIYGFLNQCDQKLAGLSLVKCIIYLHTHKKAPNAANIIMDFATHETRKLSWKLYRKCHFVAKNLPYRSNKKAISLFLRHLLPPHTTPSHIGTLQPRC